MINHRWAVAESIFAEARALPRNEWEPFLTGRCADDELRKEILDVLRGGEPPPNFLEPPSGSEPDESDGPSMEGRSLGEFRLVKKIEAGAMGTVYRARQIGLQRDVAVKVLHPGIHIEPTALERFRREPLAASKLRHPGIVSVITAGRSDGIEYYAMEYVDGPDLAREIAGLRKQKLEDSKHGTTRLPDSRSDSYIRAVAQVVWQAADALAHAHDQGIIHRDIKPNNLLIDASNRVRIVDFGIALDQSVSKLTKTGMTPGTPSYMSPEQMQPGALVDRRSDIYSLGVVLYELLTLERPFKSDSEAELRQRILEFEPVPVTHIDQRVPRDLETVCHKTLAKKPAGRYETAKDLADDLGRFLSHQAVLARPPNSIERARRWMRVHWLTSIACAAAAILVSAVLATSRYQRLASRAAILTPYRALLEKAVAETALATMPAHEIGRVKDARLAFESQWDDLSDSDRDLAHRASARLDDLKTVWLADMENDRRLAGTASFPDGERKQLASMGLMTNLAFVFERDERVQDLVRAGFVNPRIAISARDEKGNDVPSSAYLREIDVLTTGVGAEKLLGRTPIVASVESGYYRVVVVFDSGGYREFICNPGLAFMDSQMLAVRGFDDSFVDQGMVRFAATDYTLSDTLEGDTGLAGKTVHLDAYALDACEVSNGQYLEFLRANPKHQPPRYWKGELDPKYYDLPVMGVTWYDAVAYAEWAGKRLPTAAEWQYAARGREGRLLPYLPAGSPLEWRGNGDSTAKISGNSPEEDWQIYLERVAPVRSNEDARTPEGIYNLLGNVYEFTESMAVTGAGPGSVVRQWDRFCFGGAWNARTKNFTLATTGYFGIGPLYNNHMRGFRCARTTR